MFVVLCLFQVFCHSSAAVLVILMVSCMMAKSMPYGCNEDRPECYDSDGDGIVDSKLVSAAVTKLCENCGYMWGVSPDFTHGVWLSAGVPTWLTSTNVGVQDTDFNYDSKVDLDDRQKAFRW